MQGKGFLYFLFDENNNSYYQYGDTVLLSAALKPLEFTPDGWKKIQIQNQRNQTYFAAFCLLACKKKKSQYCFWQAMKNNSPIYIWEYTKPTDMQVKYVQDSCRCSITLQETCQPCKTDSSGNDFDCH